VNSVFRLLAFGFQPLRWILTGLLLQRIQVVPTILVLFGVYLLLAVSTTLNPHIRRAHFPTETEPKAKEDEGQV